MTITAAYVVLIIEVIIEENDKRWRGALREVTGRGYLHYFEMHVHDREVGQLFKRTRGDAWEFTTKTRKGQDMAEKLGELVEQFIKQKPDIKL